MTRNARNAGQGAGQLHAGDLPLRELLALGPYVQAVRLHEPDMPLLRRRHDQGDASASRMLAARMFAAGENLDGEAVLRQLARRSTGGQVHVAHALLADAHALGLAPQIAGDEAMRLYFDAARAGIPAAMRGLGLWFCGHDDHWRAMVPNFLQAAQHFRNGCDAGDPASKYCLALLHVRRVVPNPNRAVAFELMRQAGRGAVALAQAWLILNDADARAVLAPAAEVAA